MNITAVLPVGGSAPSKFHNHEVFLKFGEIATAPLRACAYSEESFSGYFNVRTSVSWSRNSHSCLPRASDS